MKTRNKGLSGITKDDITIVHGVDAFIEPGRHHKTLAIKRDKRTSFFADHKLTKNFLHRFRSNPPIEEGRFINVENRDREGELIVTTSAIRLLIDELIKKPYANSPYNTENLHVIDEDMDTIKNALNDWHNRGDVDIKIIYLNHGHMIHIYLRKEDHKTRCLVLDSEPDRPIKSLIDAIHEAIPGAMIIRSTTPLQMDYFSCPIFSTRAMKYFVKHGAETFAYIDSHTTTWNDDLRCFELQPRDLMPELMKMIQSRITLPDAALDTVVSHKKNLTLREYLEKYRIIFDGKPYNTRAVLKRYRYMDILESTLRADDTSHRNGISDLISRIEGHHNTINLHDWLMMKNSDCHRPLDHINSDLIQQQPEAVNTLAFTLRKAYGNNHKLLQELISSTHNDTLRQLILRPAPRRWQGFFVDNCTSDERRTLFTLRKHR